jgi:hypothetical protein
VSSRPSNPRFDQSNPMDRTKPILRDIAIERAYRGMLLLQVDQFVNNVSIGWVRDYGIKLDNSAAQLQHIHTYGSGQIGVWVASGQNWGNDLLLEDTTIGMKIDAHGTAFTSIVSRNHSGKNIEIAGASNTVSDVQLEVASGASGLHISGHLNQLDETRIELAGQSTGIRVANAGGTRLKITNTTIEGTGAAGQVGFLADAVLNDAVIFLDVANLSTGIDLNAGGVSRIGRNNVISITGTTNVGQLANLPATWDSSNKIYINGVLAGPIA